MRATLANSTANSGMIRTTSAPKPNKPADINHIAAVVPALTGADHCQPIVSCAHTPTASITNTADTTNSAATVDRIRLWEPTTDPASPA